MTMTEPSRRAATLLVALALALVPAACGGGDDEGQAPQATGTPGEAENPGAPSTGEGAEEGAGTAGDDGRGLFASACASCHTLAAADATGQVGPNLDELQPSSEQVLEAIRSGPGQMPEGLYDGTQAQAVADFVAQNAGG